MTPAQQDLTGLIFVNHDLSHIDFRTALGYKDALIVNTCKVNVVHAKPTETDIACKRILTKRFMPGKPDKRNVYEN